MNFLINTPDFLSPPLLSFPYCILHKIALLLLVHLRNVALQFHCCAFYSHQFPVSLCKCHYATAVNQKFTVVSYSCYCCSCFLSLFLICRSYGSVVPTVNSSVTRTFHRLSSSLFRLLCLSLNSNMDAFMLQRGTAQKNKCFNAFKSRSLHR